MRTLFIESLVVATASGCAAQSPRGPESPRRESQPAIVEYRQSGERVLLSAAGGARVDFSSAGDPRAWTHSVLLPASKEEVARVARVIATIDGPSVTDSLRETGVRIPPGIGAELSVTVDGRTRVLQIDTLQRRMSHVVDGIAQEVETVGTFGLAKAIEERRIAEELLGKSDVDRAIWEYDFSVRLLAQWTIDLRERYQFLSEPFLDHAAGLATFPITITLRADEHVHASLTASPSSDRVQLAVQSLRESWRELARGITLSETGTVTTVSYPDSGGKRFYLGSSGLPSAIPAAALKQLMPLPAGGSPATNRIPTSGTPK